MTTPTVGYLDGQGAWRTAQDLSLADFQTLKAQNLQLLTMLVLVPTDAGPRLVWADEGMPLDQMPPGTVPATASQDQLPPGLTEISQADDQGLYWSFDTPEAVRAAVRPPVPAPKPAPPPRSNRARWIVGVGSALALALAIGLWRARRKPGASTLRTG